MNKNSMVIVTSDPTRIEIRARVPSLSSMELFEYFTKPELLQKWWPKLAAVEPGVGGGYRFSWPEQKWHLFGTFVEFDEGSLLKMTWNWEHEKPSLVTQRVTITFQDNEITLVQEPFGLTSSDQKNREGVVQGWLHFLGVLAALPGD